MSTYEVRVSMPEEGDTMKCPTCNAEIPYESIAGELGRRGGSRKSERKSIANRKNAIKRWKMVKQSRREK